MRSNTFAQEVLEQIHCSNTSGLRSNTCHYSDNSVLTLYRSPCHQARLDTTALEAQTQHDWQRSARAARLRCDGGDGIDTLG